jgi:hypothetical protein
VDLSMHASLQRVRSLRSRSETFLTIARAVEQGSKRLAKMTVVFHASITAPHDICGCPE